MKPIYVIRDTNNEPNFAQALRTIIQKHRPDVNAVVIDADEQRNILKANSLLEIDQNIINLDPFSRSPYHAKLDICRVFQLDEQRSCIGYDARPEAEDLELQVVRIRDGSYFVVDDDISTGGTMAFVTGLFKLHRPGIKLLGSVSLIKLSLTEMFGKHVLEDVIDTHDFAKTAASSGLVIRGLLPNGKVGLYRELYTSPYVNLVTRAKIKDPVSFMKDFNQLTSSRRL